MFSTTFRRGLIPCVLLLCALISPRASAGPADSVYSPIVHWREWELELQGGVQDWSHPATGERASKLALAYGLTPWWRTEFVAEYSQVPAAPARLEAFEWENVFQLTQHGRYWMDMGIFAELGHNRLQRSNDFQLGPMFQKEWGRSQVNLNLLAARQLSRIRDPGERRPTEFKYVAQWKYRVSPALQPGVQVFGSLGKFGHLHSDQLRAGPALMGMASLGDGHKLTYDAAILTGLTRNTPNTTVRFRIEYEFY